MKPGVLGKLLANCLSPDDPPRERSRSHGVTPIDEGPDLSSESLERLDVSVWVGHSEFLANDLFRRCRRAAQGRFHHFATSLISRSDASAVEVGGQGPQHLQDRSAVRSDAATYERSRSGGELELGVHL